MKRVLVTRPAAQAPRLVERLAAVGIAGISVPTVALAPVGTADLAGLKRAVANADWVVITSANGTNALSRALGGDAMPPATRVAAVGPATAAALSSAGINVDAVPERYLTVAIADAMGDVKGKLVVLARADMATAELRDALRARGAIVDEHVTYRTVEGPAASRMPLRRVLDQALDAVIFTSGSTVRGLLALAPGDLRHRTTRLPAICIGPVTAGVATHAGFQVAAVAETHTADGLAATAAAYFSEEDS